MARYENRKVNKKRTVKHSFEALNHEKPQRIINEHRPSAILQLLYMLTKLTSNKLRNTERS